MKLSVKTLFVFAMIFILACQKENKIIVANAYPEPKDPDTTLISTWKNVPEGLQASVASKYIRFVRNEKPNLEQQDVWDGVAWKGERLSLQLALWSQDTLTKVKTEISDFKSDNNEVLPANIANINFVKYVITDEFASGCGYRKPEDFDASLAADVLEPINSFAIKAHETRPVWITINVPQDAKPGLYKSVVSLNIERQKSKTFNLNLKIVDKTLPYATNWKFHLDLWQNPYAVARYHEVKPWSEAHWKLLKPIMERLANAGQKVITVSLNKRPWGGQTFDAFDSMVEWHKKIDGTWTYNFSIFDKWVQMMMDLGIRQQINCYSMVPWGNEYFYFDEASNQEIKITADPDSKAYRDLWVPFLKQFKLHLEEKGWEHITQIAMDERAPKEMKAMLKILNEHAPNLGVSFADNHKSYKLYPDDLKDMSVAFGHPVDDEDLKQRKAMDYFSTHYVCCSDAFPNTFTFSSPDEAVFIGWYTMAANFDGFLRWAYNSWVETPLIDSRFRAWPAGDTYIVYPNNWSSIRFETLREGIQDAEKIRILKETLLKSNRLDDLDYLNQMVARFNTTKKPEDLPKILDNAKTILNILAEK
ncbi:DUF4091 domain-containing protein [Aestuariibaculum sp. M13]|uniref:DUF4091 domain-containing protein n=1 Tax=Aestuariibaculum sp. M13 TaxID=2967132 RepID=UPI002159DBD6|nr:DUF4091 domain-containing protein [Aestuariibaculum sp. M13]MCR8668730.1 DUF4091 domain-containing protein [Aestuariibaculum sp. M13]